MSDQKECIACAEPILAAAKLCKHCGTRQDDEAFAEEITPQLIPHVCSHSKTFRALAEEQPTAFWGGPKLKSFIDEHGSESVVAVLPKVKYSVDGAFEEMLVVTNKSLIFAGYGSFGGSEVFPLKDIKVLWLSDAVIGTGYSDTIALILDFETENQEIEVRVIPLGSSSSKALSAMQAFSEELEQIAAHIPVAHTGETVTGGYHLNFSVGFFREL
jgi:hypothetical protein